MTAHPYMANSAPGLRQELLDAVGVADAEELFAQIPAGHRLSRPLELPPPLASEAALSRHLRRTLARNVDCEQALSFLGGGVWQHHVPAVCDAGTSTSAHPVMRAAIRIACPAAQPQL